MQPLALRPAATPPAVFTDIDGTLTDHREQVPGRVFVGLERLRAAGIPVVVVTGRPGGWCDMIARQWPVHGVVGENGGLYFRRTAAGMKRSFLAPAAERASNRKALDALGRRILAEVPGCALASDQPYRELDLAIDFCEDVPPLGEDAIDRIVALFSEAGATCRVSSIHVNGWFGQYDKRGMCLRYGVEELGFERQALVERAIYAGDSPNDEPLFHGFAESVGVASVRRYVHRLTHLPAWITAGDGADGFCELVDHLLGADQPLQ